MNEVKLTSDYLNWLKDLKARIRSVQVKAALAASRELILFYWELGNDISHKIADNQWGQKSLTNWRPTCNRSFLEYRGFPVATFTM